MNENKDALSLEDDLNTLAHELYLKTEKRYSLMWPWVLLRVLPKEKTHGSLILPAAQNKPVHEALVLEVWKPHWQLRTKGNNVYRESELAPGDHVLFQHYAGVPLFAPGDQRYETYRFVREDYNVNAGGILATIERGSPEREAQILHEIIAEADGVLEGVEDLVAAIVRRFTLVDKRAASVTLSGA